MLRKKRFKGPPLGFPMYQALQQYIMRYLASSWREVFRATSAGLWPGTYFDRRNTECAVSVQSVEGCNLKLCIAPTSIRHSEAGLGVFTQRASSKGKTVGFYYGTLIYRDISKAQGSPRYGNCVLWITKEQFRKWAFKVGTSGMACNTNARSFKERIASVFIVPSKFCVCAYTNYSRYRLGYKDKAAFLGNKQRSRKANTACVISKMEKATQIHGLTQPKVVELIATCSISPGRELFVVYGSEHIIE